MKNNKFCFSKTLVYLVLILVLGAGLLWGVNYMNSQKMGSKPKASEPNKKCYVTTVDDDCNSFFKRMYPNYPKGTPPPGYGAIEGDLSYKGSGIKCCLIPIQPFNCKELANIVKSRDKKNCVVYTGNLRKLPQGVWYKGDQSDCEVRYDNGNVCGNTQPDQPIKPVTTITYINENRKAKMDMRSYCSSIQNVIVGCLSVKKVNPIGGKSSARCVGVRYFNGKVISSKNKIEGPRGCAITADPYGGITLEPEDVIKNLINGQMEAYNNNDASFLNSGDNPSMLFYETKPQKCSGRMCVNGYFVDEEFKIDDLTFKCSCNDPESPTEKPRIIQAEASGTS